MKRVVLLRRLIVLTFALLTAGGLFAVPAGAATASTTAPSISHSGAMVVRNPVSGSVHKVFKESVPAAQCKAVRKSHPKASCTITVTIDIKKVNGPQKAPAGARVNAQTAPAAAAANYWTYEVGTQTARGVIWHGTLQEEIKYHDNCPNADCPNQGTVSNVWIDDSGYACLSGCTISDRKDGVIGNNTKDLNGWENFSVNCNLTIMGNSAGCNAGHGNRLYFSADHGAWRGFSS
jgi:hypothetical protein